MEKAVRTHVGTFKHSDGVNKLQAEFTRSFQAFMDGALQRLPDTMQSEMYGRASIQSWRWQSAQCA
jgi:hypothetical protein